MKKLDILRACLALAASVAVPTIAPSSVLRADAPSNHVGYCLT